MGQLDSLVIQYDKLKVIARLIPFQIIGITILATSVLLLLGVYTTEYKVTLPLVMMTGFAMYIYFNWIILGFIKRPIFIKISKHVDRPGAILQYRDKFFEIPPGTVVVYDDRVVSIEPAVMGITHAIQRQNDTIVRLPSGLRRVGNGQIKIS